MPGTFWSNTGDSGSEATFGQHWTPSITLPYEAYYQYLGEDVNK